MASNDMNGVWRTVGGRRIFIRTGQGLSDAMKESGKFGSSKKTERANAKLKKEEPNEKYEQVDSYATYKDKFNNTWGKDGAGDSVVSAKMYTNDEFMEHLQDANWHGERKQLIEANLTNEQLSYIKDRTKVSAWGVENLTGKAQVSKLIEEAKNMTGKSNGDSMIRNAFNKYKQEHPNSKMTLADFKKTQRNG